MLSQYVDLKIKFSEMLRDGSTAFSARICYYLSNSLPKFWPHFFFGSVHTRTNLARQRELVAALLRRQEMLYAEEGGRQRALSHIKSQVEMMLTLGKQKARRLREYESGLEEDLKNSEYERRLHQQLQTEYVLESQAEGGGRFSMAGAINDHRRNMAS